MGKDKKRSKEHAIIPIFIPHKGCPNDCVFCNQRKITARTDDVTPADVRATIQTWLTTLEDVPHRAIAFYGGSFTGLSIPEQNAYLEVAEEFLEDGRIQQIHLSTRPDYIGPDILDNLKAHHVDTIELGVQSFDDQVLCQSNRGHTVSQVYEAVAAVQRYDFHLGIQLMIGLPGDSRESCIFSAKETARLQPELCRLYPTIVLDDTKLYEDYVAGRYQPLSRQEAVFRTKAMYEILAEAGITIMRVGLKSTDIIGEGGAISGGTYHPAFRQLVEGAIARERIDQLLQEALPPILQKQQHCSNACGKPSPAVPEDGLRETSGEKKSVFTRKRIKTDVFSNGKWYSNMVGNQAENRRFFAEKYPMLNLRFRRDESLRDGEFRISMKEENNGTRESRCYGNR